MAIDIQSLDNDVLRLILTQLSPKDAARISLTSRSLWEPARPRVLSFLRVTVPVQAHKLHKFLVEDEDGPYRLQCLKKLTICRSNLPAYEPTNGYAVLAHVLELAQNLHTLAIFNTEDHLTDGPVLGEAIAALRDLQELDIRGLAEAGFRLCGRLICKPSVVRLEARRSLTHPAIAVDPAALCAPPIFQNASIVSIYDFAYDTGRPVAWEDLSHWPVAHTLRLRNMEPVVLVAACPKLASLKLAYLNRIHSIFPYAGLKPHTLHAARLTIRIPMLDTFAGDNNSLVDQAISAAMLGTRPLVLSIPFFYGDNHYWSCIYHELQDPGSRVRSVEVLMHDKPVQAQQWLVRLSHRLLPLALHTGL